MSTKVDFNTLIKVALKSVLAVTDAVSCAPKRVAGTWLRVVSRIQECHQPLVPATLRGTDTSRRRDQLPNIISLNHPTF